MTVLPMGPHWYRLGITQADVATPVVNVVLSGTPRRCFPSSRRKERETAAVAVLIAPAPAWAAAAEAWRRGKGGLRSAERGSRWREVGRVTLRVSFVRVSALRGDAGASSGDSVRAAVGCLIGATQRKGGHTEEFE